MQPLETETRSLSCEIRTDSLIDKEEQKEGKGDNLTYWENAVTILSLSFEVTPVARGCKPSCARLHLQDVKAQCASDQNCNHCTLCKAPQSTDYLKGPDLVGPGGGLSLC